MTQEEKAAAIIEWAKKQIAVVKERSKDELASAKESYRPFHETLRDSKLPPALLGAFNAIFDMAFTVGADVGATGMLTHLTESCGVTMAQAIGLTALMDNGPVAEKLKRFKDILSQPTTGKPS